MSRIARSALAVGSAVLLAASLSGTAFASTPWTSYQSASNRMQATQTGTAISRNGDAEVTLSATQTQSIVQIAGTAPIVTNGKTENKAVTGNASGTQDLSPTQATGTGNSGHPRGSGHHR
jgi:hypothetical protein